jgi:uncharacterized protein YyaL (SSP411 family)
VLRAFSGNVQQYIFARATLVRMGFYAQAPLCVVLVEGEGQDALEDVLRRLSVPQLCLQYAASGKTLPTLHPAFGKGPVNGRAAAYVCLGQTCLAPVQDPAAFSEILKDVRSGQKRPAANDG